MSIDVLHMTGFEMNDRAVDIALPVIAMECEASPPIRGYMDAYEIAVLKFVEIGLGYHGISKALNATESLIESVMTNLQEKGFVDKEKGKKWTLTEAGEKYLKGEEERDRSSNSSHYGYVFVNAIKREVLPFFLEGDINQVSLYRGKELPHPLTLEGDERKTFCDIKVKKSRLREAYKKYHKIKDVKQNLDEGSISYEEAIDTVECDELFVDIDFEEDSDTFDEAEFEEVETMYTAEQVKSAELSSKMFVRALENSQKKVYLHMRLIIDPSFPGGYRVESPFRMGGIDNGFFLRQIQWFAANEKIKIGDENLQTYIEREICKISPSYHTQLKDFEVFVLEKMPLLKSQRNKHGNMYDDMSRIYSLIQNQQSLLEKENIVSSMSRNVLECLFNGFFRGIEEKNLKRISEQAQADLKVLGNKTFIQNITRKTKLDSNRIDWSFNFMKGAIGRLGTTRGNSIIEKFINIVVVNYYIGTEETNKLLNNDFIHDFYSYAESLNRVRIKVSHNTDDRFTEKDYVEFMKRVYKIINQLLEVYREV